MRRFKICLKEKFWKNFLNFRKLQKPTLNDFESKDELLFLQFRSRGNLF